VQRSCNTAPENNRHNQPGQRRELSQPAGPARNQRSRRQMVNVDTVGVTGSIPVLPTMKAPDSGAVIVSEH
jgi:hypothetical protein